VKQTRSIRLRLLGVVGAVALIGTLFSGMASAALRGPTTRYIVIVHRGGDYAGVKSTVVGRGAKLIGEARDTAWFVVSAPASLNTALSADSRMTIVPDRISKVAPAENPNPNVKLSGARGGTLVHLDPSQRTAPRGGGPAPDPAWTYKGLEWTYDRIHLADAWTNTIGSSDVTVGVSDTGLDYTHSDLAGQVVHVEDFTLTEDPPLCETYFGVGDDYWAEQFGVPQDLDFHGHGSWIGGNIAGNLDGLGMNGIAPGIKLVSLKIAQWCGYAYDTELLMSYQWAYKNGVNIVSNSFGGYLDRSDPAQDAVWKLYVKVVSKARQAGTTIVAAAGNEHLQIGAQGLVTSHGPLTAVDTDPADFTDYFGWYESPGGIPGVVDVSSTGRQVIASSDTCPPGTEGSSEDTAAGCKFTSDPHQAAGSSMEDQLAYYSNYGARIDVAGPGGARKFNLPVWDRGGTPGFPVTDYDLTNAWEDFSITSNYATQIPCYIFTEGSGFPPGQCYSSIQGTSMATPHASAAMALIASAMPQIAHKPKALLKQLKAGARDDATNYTEVLSASDLAGGDLYGDACATGYCHLGGSAISSWQAYGAGIVDVAFLAK
jgi:lantibiotic leader peptide-processing serine protease